MRVVRAVCLVAGLALAGAGLAWTLAPFLRAPGELGSAGPVPAVVTACAWLLVGCLVWLLLSVVVAVHDVLRNRRSRPLVTPELVRRLAVVCVGLGLTGSVTGMASAQPAPPSAGPAAGSARLLDGLVVPDRAEDDPVVPPDPRAPRPRVLVTAPAVPTPTATPAPGPEPPAPRRAGEPATTVVVHPGDSLWRIAAARLPAETGPAGTDAAWRRLYAANRPPLGADPDLIHPGDVLRIPRDLTSDREESR